MARWDVCSSEATDDCADSNRERTAVSSDSVRSSSRRSESRRAVSSAIFSSHAAHSARSEAIEFDCSRCALSNCSANSRWRASITAESDGIRIEAAKSMGWKTNSRGWDSVCDSERRETKSNSKRTALYSESRRINWLLGSVPAVFAASCFASSSCQMVETWKPKRERELAIRSAENSFGTPQTFDRSSSKRERRSLRESASESSAWKSFSIEFDRRVASCYGKMGKLEKPEG